MILMASLICVLPIFFSKIVVHNFPSLSIEYSRIDVTRGSHFLANSLKVYDIINFQ